MSPRTRALSLVTRVADPAHRREAARALAAHLGAEDMVVFVPDVELGVLLPAPGLAQTLPGGRAWRAFLAECTGDGQHSGQVPFPDAQTMSSAMGVAAEDGSVLVLVGGEPRPDELSEVRPVLPLLAAALRREQHALAASGRAAAAQQAATDAQMLAKALDAALAETEAARAAAQELAETLDTINRTGQLLAAELDLERLVQAITDAATELAGAEFGAFFYNVDDQQGESYQLYTLSGAPREDFAQFPLPRATELFGPTFRGEGIVRLDDVTRDPRYGKNPPYHGEPPGHLPVVSYLAVPVVSRSGRVLGGLFLGHSQAGVFTERAEHVIGGLATQAAVAMDNARLYQEVREQVEMHVQLNAALRETAEARDQALAELQQLLRTRDEFLSSVAHDLNTPLANIKARAQLLRRRATRAGTPEAAKVAEGLESIETSATRMAAMVDELLDTVRLQLGQALELNRRRADLVSLARRAATEQQQASDRHQIRVEAAVTELVGAWDTERLERVLANLLENAIKYSPEGGEILVTVRQEDDPEGGWAVVTVQDHGLGIPAADLPHIFQRFHRAHNVGHIGGTGIGLSGVRSIVESHGGTIEVESREGEGSSFSVRLPREIERIDAVHSAG